MADSGMCFSTASLCAVGKSVLDTSPRPARTTESLTGASAAANDVSVWVHTGVFSSSSLRGNSPALPCSLSPAKSFTALIKSCLQAWGQNKTDWTAEWQEPRACPFQPLKCSQWPHQEQVNCPKLNPLREKVVFLPSNWATHWEKKILWIFIWILKFISFSCAHAFCVSAFCGVSSVFYWCQRTESVGFILRITKKKPSLIYSPWTFTPNYFRRVQLGNRNNGVWPRTGKPQSSDAIPPQIQTLECTWKYCKRKLVEEGLSENFE